MPTKRNGAYTAKLPKDPSEILSFRYEEHQTLQAIASKYGVTREAVRQYLGHAKLPSQPTRIALLKSYKYGICTCGRPLDRYSGRAKRHPGVCGVCRSALRAQGLPYIVEVECPQCHKHRAMRRTYYLQLVHRQEIDGVLYGMCRACWLPTFSRKGKPRVREHSYPYPPQTEVWCRVCGERQEIRGSNLFHRKTVLVTDGHYTHLCVRCWHRPDVQIHWREYKANLKRLT